MKGDSEGNGSVPASAGCHGAASQPGVWLWGPFPSAPGRRVVAQKQLRPTTVPANGSHL